MGLIQVGVRAGSATIGLLCLWASPALAMEFKVIRVAEGQRAVMATGKIIPGDARRLAAALQAADRDQWGNKTIGLWSLGGSATEAFAMVRVMDSERVTTIVPPNMYCASACSQVLFISGTYRAVLDGGQLGMHTCSIDGRVSERCNIRLEINAVARGVPLGSVMTFMKYTQPDDVIWFGAKDADCWGFTRWPPGFHRGRKLPCVQGFVMGR